MSNIIKHRFTITYEADVDSTTGEIIKTVIVNKTDSKKESKKEAKKNISNDEPKLILDDSKYTLNDAAISLMQVSANDKIDIKYESTQFGTIPVIGSDEIFETHSGNKLTKSNTVAYRGTKNSELAKFGNEFTIKKHETKDGLFILVSNNAPIQEVVQVEDENIQIDNSFDFDLGGLIDSNETTEIDSSLFKF